MSCDTEKRCDENKGFSSLRGLVYVRGARETLNSKTSRRRRMKSTYFTLQFISRGKCTGIWRQTKTHQSLAIRWLQDTHTHTRPSTRVADNKSLLALPFQIQSWQDLKAAKRLWRLKLFTSHFPPISPPAACIQSAAGVFSTRPSSHLQASQLW